MKKDDEILMENERRQEMKETVSSLYGISRQRIALNCYASDVAPDITGDRKKKYVTVNIPKAWQCGGLGNQVFRCFKFFALHCCFFPVTSI